LRQIYSFFSALQIFFAYFAKKTNKRVGIINILYTSALDIIVISKLFEIIVKYLKLVKFARWIRRWTWFYAIVKYWLTVDCCFRSTLVQTAHLI